jgi:hemoglobin
VASGQQDTGETRSVSLYEACGGAEGLRRLVARFYDLMDTLPEARSARAIHPEALDRSRESLFEYLSGWLGGPPLFVERRGPPMLRMRHLHAPIGHDEIEGWLACFRQAWRDTIADPAAADIVLPRIEALARHMRNVEPQDASGGARGRA